MKIYVYVALLLVLASCLSRSVQFQSKHVPQNGDFTAFLKDYNVKCIRLDL
jgi:hypothetical protein